jgi:predicted molibdopterin-dependent oxidoreductase YjgC
VGQRGGYIDWIDASHRDGGPCHHNVLARRRRCQKPLRDEGRRNMPFGIPIRGVARRFMAITQSFGDQALAGFSSAKCLNEDNYFFQKLS